MAAAVSGSQAPGPERHRREPLAELGRVEEARPFLEHMIALGRQHDMTHRDFAKLVTFQSAWGLVPAPPNR